MVFLEPGFELMHGHVIVTETSGFEFALFRQTRRNHYDLMMPECGSDLRIMVIVCSMGLCAGAR